MDGFRSSPGLSGTLSSVQVRTAVAPKFRVSRPSSFTSSEPPEERVQFNFEYERGLIKQNEEEGGTEIQEKAAAVKEFEAVEEARIRPYLSREGDELPRDVVKLALAMLPPEPTFETVKTFCQHFSHMKSMGFKDEMICGALSVHGDDVQAAISSCLDT